MELKDQAATTQIGQVLGALLTGGVTIELVGDVGAGKTTLTKAIAAGMGVEDDVQSPTFTLSRTYETSQGLRLAHYDFYRLHDAGILASELAESIHDAQTVTVVEWAAIVAGVLPDDRLTLSLQATSPEVRQLTLTAGGPTSQALLERLVS